MVQVGEAWMPILCSIECARTSLRVPSGITFGTRNSELPSVPGAFRLAAQRADIGAGLRLGELHGAHPFAAHQFAEILPLERVGAVGGERIDPRHGQRRAA